MAIDIRTGRQLACKVIDLRSVREKETERNLREVEIMKDLSHVRMLTNLAWDSWLTKTQPNVVRLEKVFQTVNTLWVAFCY